MIPLTHFSPASIQLMNLFPLPNAPGTALTATNNWVGNSSIGGDNNQYVGRVDQNVSDKQHILGRFTHFNDFDLPTDPFGNGVCLDRCSDRVINNSFVFHDIYTVSPTTVVDISPSYFATSTIERLSSTRIISRPLAGLRLCKARSPSRSYPSQSSADMIPPASLAAQA